MLRGVNNSTVPVAGTWFIDIPKPQSLRVVKAASGDMMSADGVLARDQVPTDVNGPFSARESTDSGSSNRDHSHGSQPLTLRANQERFTQDDFPCPAGRGPIEASFSTRTSNHSATFPCPAGRGPIEARFSRRSRCS